MDSVYLDDVQIVELRLRGVPVSAIGRRRVREALRRLAEAVGPAELNDAAILLLIVAGASPDLIKAATGMSKREIIARARLAATAVKKPGARKDAAQRRDAPAKDAPAFLENQWVKYLRERK